ncbi:hypothetical protein [Pseudomonas aeruginosa]|uniref:hypothetical protein n=1 Tax=Pseudomonas aeruginosa TaxID=287 RepID=UPI002076B56C|nr:hypothetical protein [Pseudomonas aeruginosa]MCM8577012.1 hypothetical protein [Pseudomonas aeruginosa]MDQ4223342.1 hypothetical protein [Pseudomonas aeruginosa]
MTEIAKGRTTVANVIRVVFFIASLAVIWQALRFIQGEIGNPAAPIFDMLTQSPRDSIAGTIDEVMRVLFGIVCWMGLAVGVGKAGEILSRVVEFGWRQYLAERREAQQKERVAAERQAAKDRRRKLRRKAMELREPRKSSNSFGSFLLGLMIGGFFL